MNGETGENPTLFPVKVGEKLREARLAQGMELSEIAARTRVPLRHLEAIETSDYSGLPSPTYAVGFVRAYARAVGADEVALARELRAETAGTFTERPVYERYDPQDPVREPSSGLVWIGAIIAVVLLVGVGIWYGTDWLRGGAGTPAPQPTATAIVPDIATAPTPATGRQVTLTATQPVWLRIYDADGNRLLERELAAGERYDVPPDAKGPMINVGRPESLQVSVNGSNVAPLGPAGRAIKDVPISAEALLARGNAAAPAPAASATPTPGASPTPRAVSTSSAPASRPTARPTVSPTPVLPPAFADNATAP
jgi:transcriptional regulator with XRE-family HTH domain